MAILAGKLVIPTAGIMCKSLPGQFLDSAHAKIALICFKFPWMAATKRSHVTPWMQTLGSSCTTRMAVCHCSKHSGHKGATHFQFALFALKSWTLEELSWCLMALNQSKTISTTRTREISCHHLYWGAAYSLLIIWDFIFHLSCSRSFSWRGPLLPPSCCKLFW